MNNGTQHFEDKVISPNKIIIHKGCGGSFKISEDLHVYSCQRCGMKIAEWHMKRIVRKLEQKPD